MRTNNPAASTLHFRSYLTILLAIVLTLSSFAGLAYAEDTITGITFENVTTSKTIYIDDDTFQIDAVATISQSNSTKNVTLDASWSSSNTSIVKVTGGLLTAVAKGSAIVTATYKGFKTQVTINVDYLYDSVKIRSNGVAVGASATVKLGDDIAYELIASKSGNADQTAPSTDVRWTSSNTNVATFDNNAIKLLAAGETTITAKYKGRTDTVKLTVTSPYKSLSISPDSLLEMKMGDSDRQLTATALTNDNTSSVVTNKAVWTSSSTAVVTVVNGTVTPVSFGTATITAEFLGVNSTVSVVVRPAYEALRLSPKEEQHLLLKDSPITLSALALNGNTAPEDVTTKATWTSSSVFVATVDKFGVVTPKGVGTTIIKASYMGLTQQVTIMVYPTVDNLVAAKDKLDAFVDDTVTLPKISATSISDETVDVSSLVTWTSSDRTILDKVDGKWKAKKPGTAILTGSIQSKTVTVTINVHEKPLLLSTDQPNLSVVIGKEMALPTITMTYESGTEEDVTGLVTWKSSSPNLLVKAPNVKGIQASSVTLTATYLGKSTTVRVTIEEEITKLVLDSDKLSSISPGKAYTIKVTGYYKSGKTIALASKINWSLDQEDLATIKAGSLKALKEGSGKLTGTYQGKSIVIPFSIIAKLKKLTPSVKTITLAAGAKESVKVSGEYEGGRTTDISALAAWTTGNNKVATVDNGVVTAVAKGSTNIKAVSEGKSITIRVTVK